MASPRRACTRRRPRCLGTVPGLSPAAGRGGPRHCAPRTAAGQRRTGGPHARGRPLRGHRPREWLRAARAARGGRCRRAPRHAGRARACARRGVGPAPPRRGRGPYRSGRGRRQRRRAARKRRREQCQPGAKRTRAGARIAPGRACIRGGRRPGSERGRTQRGGTALGAIRRRHRAPRTRSRPHRAAICRERRQCRTGGRARPRGRAGAQDPAQKRTHGRGRPAADRDR